MKMVKVNLQGTVGYGDVYYNSQGGGTYVPLGLARTLGLKPVGASAADPLKGQSPTALAATGELPEGDDLYDQFAEDIEPDGSEESGEAEGAEPAKKKRGRKAAE